MKGWYVMEEREFQKLLEQARRIKITPEMAREHKISFVYGNLAIENPSITREMVEKVLDEMEKSKAAK